MDIVQTFYDKLASQYDQLFQDWQETTKEQALILDRIFRENGMERTARILDCACGIGTQSIGLAALGYSVTGSDISDAELAQARLRAEENDVMIRFEHADFRALSEVFSEQFSVVICMDNALPHMLSRSELETAIRSILARVEPDGLFVASVRDYDELLECKPRYSPPYIHKTEKGQRVCFQTWDWEGDHYKLIQYMIDDAETAEVTRFECVYRALRRQELTDLLLAAGCREVMWKFPQETGFYQPILIARK